MVKLMSNGRVSNAYYLQLSLTDTLFIDQLSIDGSDAAMNASNVGEFSDFDDPPDIPVELLDLSVPDAPRRILPNSRTPCELDTEDFVGKVQFKLRIEPEDPYFASYFAGEEATDGNSVPGETQEED